MKQNILIFEDERLTAERLVQLVKRYDPEINILDILSSIKQGLEWFRKNTQPDLILMDIHLSDGSCFELFNKTKMDAPVIFTTAYDEYAIKAFKVNSVDYLLKPIDYNELVFALKKFDQYRKQGQAQNQEQLFETLYEQINRANKYKQRFLVKIGEQLKRIESNNIAWFIFEDGLVWAVSKNNTRLPMDYSLEQLEQMLDPMFFFRINRKMIINQDAIEKIHTYFNSRLKLHLQPETDGDVIISRERVNDFKSWLA